MRSIRRIFVATANCMAMKDSPTTMNLSGPLFTWAGRYAGFRYGDNIFTSRGAYAGWIDTQKMVWSRHGRYLGEVVEGNYVLRPTMRLPPIPRVPRIPPIPPIPPLPPIPRIPRIPRVGWIDALAESFE